MDQTIFRDLEEGGLVGGREMGRGEGRTHITRPCVEVDGTPRWNNLALVRHIFYARARQIQSQDGEVAQTLAHQRDDVRAFLVVVGICQGLQGGVVLADSLDGFVLDVGALG